MTVRPRIIGQRIDEGEQNVQVLGEQIRGHRRLDVRGDRRPAGLRFRTKRASTKSGGQTQR